MIPWVLIAVGGTMIFAGVRGTDPLAVLKAVLSGEPLPGASATSAGTTSSSTSPSTGAQQIADSSLQSPTGSYDPKTQANRNANTNSNSYQSPTGSYDPAVQNQRNNYTPGGVNSTPLTSNGGRVAK